MHLDRDQRFEGTLLVELIERSRMLGSHWWIIFLGTTAAQNSDRPQVKVVPARPGKQRALRARRTMLCRRSHASQATSRNAPELRWRTRCRHHRRHRPIGQGDQVSDVIHSQVAIPPACPAACFRCGRPARTSGRAETCSVAESNRPARLAASSKYYRSRPCQFTEKISPRPGLAKG